MSYPFNTKTIQYMQQFILDTFSFLAVPKAR